MEPTLKKAVLLGATGLVGAQLLDKLLASPAYGEVTAIVRRPLPERAKLKQVVLADFAAMSGAAFAGAEDVFCALGTTIKQAGSQARFREVDYDYPVAAARLAKEAGARRYVLVSSMGADPASKIFYSRVKGETEAAIRALQLPMTSIVRPSLLLGDRRQFRFGERVAALLSRPLAFVFRGSLLKYRPIESRDVAAVMLRVAQMYAPGTHIYENDQLHRMAPNS
ncbi:oxidoreductase [Paenibacillus sp.]|uniref:oxidoreductase n=1 Tax=Paenibacillus sp. TaxID=58172 RepID=UPI0028111E17|nr:oxidoreductase [Paenibacillus sp.]